MISPEDILDLWFGDLDDHGAAAPERVARWWSKDPAFDALLTKRFGEALAAASVGELDEWLATPRGAVALIILLDQFSRNIHRDTPDAFANDPRALACTQHVMDSAHWDALGDMERYFALMPLMHSEDLAVHRDAANRFQQAHDNARSDACRAALSLAVDFLARHTAIIERFGRYPHRNAILDRESTAEEIAFLTEPGSSF